MDKIHTCKTCPCYVPPSKGDKFGSCRFFPPQVYPSIPHTRAGLVMVSEEFQEPNPEYEKRNVRFPDVLDDWWCMKHPENWKLYKGMLK